MGPSCPLCQEADWPTVTPRRQRSSPPRPSGERGPVGVGQRLCRAGLRAGFGRADSQENP